MGNICSVCGSDNSDTAKFCNECGQTLGTKAATKSKPVALKQGTILKGNRYITRRLIKAGGMGAVYEATDKKTNEIFAIKELWTYVSTAKEREYLVKRFESEAKLLSKLNHMSLPRVYDYFIDNERYYLVMDFIDGWDLDNLIRRDGKPGLPQEEVVKWGIQICEVLDYLHNSNPPIIYRDLKPSNIMLRNSDRRIVLIDFGIACALEDNTSGNPRTMIGTMGYIAPEQYLGKPVPASDIYSLGGTLYNLLTGSMPVPFSYKHMTSIVPEIATGIEEIVCRSLNLKAEERYESAREVKAVLEKVLESEILALRTIKEKPRLSRWKISGELPELSDILSDMGLDIVTVEKTDEKDTKEMKDAHVELNDMTEADKQEHDTDKMYIDLLEEIMNTDQESLGEMLQSKEKYLDERFFEIFDHTLEYVTSEDKNLAEELNNLNKIMISMSLRKIITEEGQSESEDLFDEDFIETSVEDDETPLSQDRTTGINKGFTKKKEELFDEDFIDASAEVDEIPLSPDRTPGINKGFTEKKEACFDEDFIDFSEDREEKTLIETNLSEEYEGRYDTFDEDAANTDFTEENIEEIFSTSEFIHKEKSEHNRELHEEDYPAEEVDISVTEDYNNIDEASGHINDNNHIPDEHIEEVNIKDHLKIDMACDMLEEEMIISDSLWETEEETIDLSFNDDDIIDLEENIPKTPGTNPKQIRPSENIIIKKEKSNYIQDNAQKYFEEAQKLIGEEHFEQAVRLCEKALDYNDEFLEVHYTLGTIYKKINRSDLAVESYKKYLALKQKKSTEKISKKK
ncbi:MAG: protein kinase [Candidatus Eremiobacterota bacterium]